MPRPKSDREKAGTPVSVPIYKDTESVFNRIFALAKEAGITSRSRAVEFALVESVDWLETSGEERKQNELRRQLEEAEAKAREIRETLESAANDNKEMEAVREVAEGEGDGIPKAFKRNKKGVGATAD